MKISGRICDTTGSPLNGVQIKAPGVGDFQVDSSYSIEVSTMDPNSLNFSTPTSGGRLVQQLPTTGDVVCNVVLKAGGGAIAYAAAQNEFKAVYKGESVNENTETTAPGAGAGSGKFPAWIIPVAIVVLVVVFWKKIKGIFKKS